MDNKEIAKIFKEIAAFYEMQSTPFKSRAYRRVAENIEELNQEIIDIYKRDGVEGLKKEIPGTGKRLALRLEEIIKTGKLKVYEKLKKQTPIKLDELLTIEGVGPKTAFYLYKKLKIKNVEDLEKAALNKKISRLPNFGIQSEKKIIQGIKFFKKNRGRFLLGNILPIAKNLQSKLDEIPEIKKAVITGSIRRMEETIGDIDILITTKYPKKIIDKISNITEIKKVTSSGAKKISLQLKEGIRSDIRIISSSSFGAALQYFTGDKNHNIALRKIAKEKKLKLNEYGLFRNKKVIAGKNEQEVYQKLSMQYIEPELRNNEGELEAASNNNLPKLITKKDIKGDLHLHSHYSDGANSILELAMACHKIGYEYLAISDHVGSLKIASALSEKDLLGQIKEIDQVNKKLKRKKINIKILKSAETNIKKDGDIDLEDRLLSKLDLVVASVHSHFGMEEEEMTERIIKAMKNPYVNIIGHPTGRIIFKRPPYKIHIEKIIKASKIYKVALEVNSYFSRLDLCDNDIRKAVKMNAKLIINTDAHNASQLNMIELGVRQARRGWAQKKNILNAQKLKTMLDWFKSK